MYLSLIIFCIGTPSLASNAGKNEIKNAAATLVAAASLLNLITS